MGMQGFNQQKKLAKNSGVAPGVQKPLKKGNEKQVVKVKPSAPSTVTKKPAKKH